MKRIIFIFSILINFIFRTYGQHSTTVSAPGSYNYTIPCGVTSLTVHCWGAGGGGAGDGTNGGSSGSGGGSGGYSVGVFTVTAGSVVTLTVGAGGAGGASNANGGNGGATTFSNSTTLQATGGTGGAHTSGAAGTGGTGNVSNGNSGTVGGAIGGSGGAAPSGGLGGVGASGLNGTAGTAPGGGGGGGDDEGFGTRNGGAGGSGRVLIYLGYATGYSPCSAIAITSSPFTYSGNTSVSGCNFMTGGCNGNEDNATGSGNDFFFSYTATANSYLQLQMTGLSVANWQEVAVLSATNCAGPWACLTNGAWSGGLQNAFTTSTDCRIVYFQNAGTYYFKVDGDAGDNGPFTLSAIAYTPTPGDACYNATGMTGSVTYSMNNTNCTNSMGTDDPTPSSLFCAGTVENTNWMVFQSNGNGIPVSVNVNSVTCTNGYWVDGAPFGGYYSASGQFGILSSSTGSCGGTYSAATTCTNLSTGISYSTSLTNTAVTNYYFVWDGNGGAECSYQITVTNVIPLPIELRFFDAIVNGEYVDLIWATDTEKDNDFFTIQRSSDGINFENVEIVKGAGDNLGYKEYKVKDFEPINGVSYYRLQQTDFNRKTTVSQMEAVEFNNKNKFSVELYPNPNSDNYYYLKLNDKINRYINIKIFDLAGKIISDQILDNVNNNNEIEMKHDLLSGIYFMEFKNALGQKIYKKMIVN